MLNLPGSDRILGSRDPAASGIGESLNQLPLGVFQSSPEGKLQYLNRFLSGLLEAGDAEQDQEAESLRRHIGEQIKRCVLSGEASAEQHMHSSRPPLLIRTFPVRGESERSNGVVGLVEYASNASGSRSKLEKKISELSIFCELSKVLSSTLNLEEVLRIVLIAVTAGQGLGFNRAFLLLLSHDGTVLEGKMAIGPSSPEEAKRTWDSLSAREQSLEEVLKLYRSTLKGKDVAVNAVVRKLRIPISEEKNPLIRSMLSKKASVVARGEAGRDAILLNLLQTDQFAVAPLISKDRMLGVVVADNLITQKAIEDDDLKLLSICAHHASVAIENSRLYRELREKVDKLAEANTRIAESSRRLLKVEKLSILGQITSQLAHELRNPMTIIGGFARSILKKMKEDDPDSEYLKIMVKETERMEDVLDNVLNFSKPDTANLHMVDLNELVNQTLEMMEPEIDSSRISTASFPSEKLPEVRANPDLVRQALLNVFRNAIGSMPQGGILSITTRRTGSGVRVEIKDTGSGISRKHLGKIFDAFFTTNPEACGLGLTVSSEIVKNHGGDIGAVSKEGEGTTLYIELPSPKDATEESSSVPEEQH